MKQLVLLAILFCSLTLTAATVQPGLRISEYPNTPTFHPSDLMLLATTNTSPRTNKNMKMGDLALQIVNSNKVVVLDGTNTLVVNTFTNGTNFYAVNSTAGDGDAGGTNARQFGFLSLTNLALNPNVVTNILGAGTVAVTSNNLGTFTITGAASSVGVGLAPGTTTIVVDGSLNTRTSVLTSASSIIFSNMIVGQTLSWWGFSSDGAWNVDVPQLSDSNSVSRGVEQPFTNNWVQVEATKMSDGLTNFASRAPPFTIGPGTNTVFDTNLITRHISVSAAGASGGGIPSGYQTNQFTTNITGTPVLGSLWLNGNTGTHVTNGARTGLEFIPAMNSFRVGGLGSLASVSNYWDSTNIGVGSFAHGTNVLAIGPYSTVHGMANLIRTNSYGSSISGGSNNTIGTNVFYSVIGGGSINTIGDNHINGTIGGGTANIIDGGAAGSTSGGTVGGGNGNRVYLQNGFIGGGTGHDVRTVGGTIGGGANNDTDSGDYGIVGGGEGNRAEGDWAVVVGGNNNSANAQTSGADGAASAIVGGSYNTIGSIAGNTGGKYSFIGGGRTNLIPDASDYGVIGGGSLNQIGGGGNAVNGNAIVGGFNNMTDDLIDFAFIGGGVKNKVSGDWGAILGGVSNNITANYGYAVGTFLTNTTTKSVEIGITNTSKMRVEAFSTRMIGMGTLYASNSFAMPSAATLGLGGYWVGNSNGFLVTVYTLDGTTTEMKVLAP